MNFNNFENWIKTALKDVHLKNADSKKDYIFISQYPLSWLEFILGRSLCAFCFSKFSEFSRIP